MKRAGLLFALLGIGCSARVLQAEETDGDGIPVGSTSGGGDDTRSDSGGVDDGPFSTGPTSLPPGTSGPDTFGSTGFGSSGGVAGCWTSSDLFLLPEDARLFVADQDGDGLAELWVSFFSGGGPGSASDVFVVSSNGEPLPVGLFPGFFTGLHDIDGDGVLDGVGFAFGGGGPPDLAFIRGVPGFPLDGPPIPTSLGFEDGFRAFVDMTNDGIADFIRNADGTNITELLLGDGAGGFQADVAVGAPFPGDLSAMPIDGSGTILIAQTEFFDPPGECQPHALAGISLGLDALLTRWVSPALDGYVFNAPLKAWLVESAELVLARACSPETGASALVLLNSDGDQFETTVFPEANFVAAGDFDGLGFPDLAMGDGVGITFVRNNGSTSFGDSYYDEVPVGDPVLNRVYVVDIDDDGRDEIILGTHDGGSEIVYKRLDLEDC